MLNPSEHRPLQSLLILLVITLGTTPVLLRSASGYDFSALTALADGALNGSGVDQPIPGFEIRLLKDGEAIYHESFGDWSLDRVAKADSSTKTLSGAVIMSLVDSSSMNFSLDSQVGDFLFEYGLPALRDMTIRQTFSHTAGFDAIGPTSLTLLNSNITLREAAFRLSLQPLVNGPPGSTFGYGGLSMHVAGAAAEVATGERFIDLFSQRITTPLGMSNTVLGGASQDNPRVSGGAESTATDFSRFMDMLLNDGVDRISGTTVLSSEAVAEMLTRQTTDQQAIAFSPTDNARYGIGVWLDQLDQVGPGVDALAGGARGFHSWIDQSEGLVFTFATDTTLFDNVALLSSTMHAAILAGIHLSCDFNEDQSCNLLDLNLLLAEGPIAGGVPVIDGQNEAFDLNADGVIDLADRDQWLGEAAAQEGLATPYPLGDANLDHSVDVSDFNLWNSNKFTTTLRWNDGEFNGDGAADTSDFNLWNSHKFGSTDAAVPVPEPSSSPCSVIVLIGYYLVQRCWLRETIRKAT